MSYSEWVIILILSKRQSSEMPRELIEHLRDLQKHKINIYIEFRANLKTHLRDLILLAQNSSISVFFLHFTLHGFTSCMHKLIVIIIKINLNLYYTFMQTKHTRNIYTLWLVHCLFTKILFGGWWDLAPARLVHKAVVVIWTQHFISASNPQHERSS